MAKLHPTVAIEEMEAQLGYKIAPKNVFFGTTNIFYSDLTLFVDDLSQRTVREFDLFKGSLHCCQELAPAVLQGHCEQREILSESGSITFSRTYLTGYYEYFADVRYAFDLSLRFLLTAKESLAITAVNDRQCSSTEDFLAVDDSRASTAALTIGQVTLLSLPLEIREIIYKHVLGDRVWYIYELKTRRSDAFCPALVDLSGFIFPFGKADTLLRVSKQVRHEALPVAYQGTSMHAIDIDSTTALLMAIGHIGRENITSLKFGWESYADTQINWSKPQISENINLTLPRLHVPTCICLLKQCSRLSRLSLVLNDFTMTDIPLAEFQSNYGVLLCCSIEGITRLDIEDIVGNTLEKKYAALWLKEKVLGI